MTATTTLPALPLSGVVCHGSRVELGWPEPTEYDLLTAMRNRPAVRERFLDARPLDPERNRAWLATGMRRPFEGVLAIRLGGSPVGMIGWSHWDPKAGTLELGRVIVAADAVRRAGVVLPPDYPGVAADAAITLRDALFTLLDVQVMRSVYFADNALAARLNVAAGGTLASRRTVERPDGRTVELVEMQMTRETWLAHHASPAGGVFAMHAGHSRAA